MRHLLKSVITVSSFAILSRLLSFYFKTFLANYIGVANLGIYQVATSIFFVLVSVTCTGLPLAISKQTAQYHAQLDKQQALLQESKSVSACIAISVLFSLAMFGVFGLFGGYLRPLFGDAEAFNVFLMVLPALIALGFSSPIRSALWGRKLYTTTSILEIVEQTLRIGFCILFVLLLDQNKLYITAWTFSLATILTAIICIIFYYKKGGKIANPKHHFKPLLMTGIPITATRISNSIVFMLISLAIPFFFTIQGMETQEAMAMLGASVGLALPLLFVPNTIVGSLAYIMIPTLSQLNIKSKELSLQINSAIKVSALIACSFVAAFYVIGHEAGLFLFNNNSTSGEFLQYSAWILIPIALESITSSMLNALELETRGFVNYLIGSAVMFGIMFSFINGFSLQVFSIALGVSLTLSTILDIVAIQRKTKIKLTFIAPFIICLLLIIPTLAFTQNIYSMLEKLQSGGIWTFLRLAATGAISVAFFVGLIMILDLLGISAVISDKRSIKKLAKKQKIM
ncbi:MAG: oligosaccharide flippase family protein [Firmicutes bacterium]|nr:oligosaccharide flippase family protein [Bacillota bacterium]MCL1953853.1 oligosaccharide flippase family protein [Bacillota bacterium]